MSDVWLNIVMVVVFVLIGGAFSGAVIALVSLRESQVRNLADRGRRGHALQRLLGDPNRFLAAVQVGVTLAGAAAPAVRFRRSDHLRRQIRVAGTSSRAAPGSCRSATRAAAPRTRPARRRPAAAGSVGMALRLAQRHLHDGLIDLNAAARLWLKERTVETQVGSIMIKLGLRESAHEHRRVSPSSPGWACARAHPDAGRPPTDLARVPIYVGGTAGFPRRSRRCLDVPIG